ncbi:hypothetical protein [Desulfotomaculum nigrificans]|uniref:hypothetical protein n=1 Tax=Desulfotomaculum nigrificans TaxID=1565 RepID=UPI0001FAE1BD|nr:hypothetical protein [Desulfotomaculum nigrificans]
MINRQKTSADVELIVELYEKDKATLTAMLINIREIIIVNQPDNNSIVAKIKQYLKDQGVNIPDHIISSNQD